MRFMDAMLWLFIAGAALASAGVGGLIGDGHGYRRAKREEWEDREHIRDIEALYHDPAPLWPTWGEEDAIPIRGETVRTFGRWARARLRRRSSWTWRDIPPTPPADLLAEHGWTLPCLDPPSSAVDEPHVPAEEPTITSVRAIGRAHVPHPLSLPLDEPPPPVKIDRTPWTLPHPGYLRTPGSTPARHAAPDDEPTDPLTDSGIWYDLVSRLEAMGVIDPLALPCTHCEGTAPHPGCPGCACPCTTVVVTP